MFKMSYSRGMKSFDKNIEKMLLSRFLRYVKVWTTSDEKKADEGIIPSTERQLDLAQILQQELLDFGLENVVLTEYGYVFGRLPATKGFEAVPSVGFLAHMDTSSEVSGENVNPQVIDVYDGTKIVLKEGVVLDPAKDSCLARAEGETIITTDGTTLLGSDDKAGIAVIMTVLDLLLHEGSTGHGQIEVLFSPDEETGHGMDKVPLELIESKECYTIDGGSLGELELECFTAWKSEVRFRGIAKHTGSAFPDMVNAVSMAACFVSLLPQNESPEATQGYSGFYAPMEITGQLEDARVLVYLRDYTDEAIERRKKVIDELARVVEYKFFGGRSEVVHTKQYVNMKEKVKQFPHIQKKLLAAAERVGIEAVFKPIRGGTDGSRLTELGIPTPNIFTGGHNFHSRSEWNSLTQMGYAAALVREIVCLTASGDVASDNIVSGGTK